MVDSLVTELNYAGRIIYNRATEYSVENLFIGGSRYAHAECSNIIEAIGFIRSTNIRICGLITTNGISEMYHESYSTYCSITITNSKNCSTQVHSNVESHAFSKPKGCHKSLVFALPSYVMMDFSCFDNISNSQIKKVMKGENGVDDMDNISGDLSLIISMFLCESGRNPEALITLPMCLEISEYIYDKVQTINDINEKEELVNDILENEYSVRLEGNTTLEVVDAQLEKALETPTRGNITKFVIANFFPMAMQYAVRGCRYISQVISNKIDEDAGDHSSIRHSYDINKGAVKEAKQIVLHEHDLVDYYKNYKTYNGTQKLDC
jgi:hypothetical protein